MKKKTNSIECRPAASQQWQNEKENFNFQSSIELNRNQIIFCLNWTLKFVGEFIGGCWVRCACMCMRDRVNSTSERCYLCVFRSCFFITYLFALDSERSILHIKLQLQLYRYFLDISTAFFFPLLRLPPHFVRLCFCSRSEIICELPNNCVCVCVSNTNILYPVCVCTSKPILYALFFDFHCALLVRTFVIHMRNESNKSVRSRKTDIRLAQKT